MNKTDFSRTNDLIKQNNLNDNHHKSLIFQRRQLQNEKNVEDIVKTNTEKVNTINSRAILYILKNSRRFMNVVAIFIHLLKQNSNMCLFRKINKSLKMFDLLVFFFMIHTLCLLLVFKIKQKTKCLTDILFH